MYMIFFVLDDTSKLDAVLDAWDAIGVTGATIIDSTGINRRRRARQVGAPFMGGINRLMTGSHETHYTLITVVKDEATVKECLKATEAIVGDLNQPNSGVLAAWPVSIVKGIPEELA